MALDTKDIEKIAHLARIQINEADIAPLSKKLTTILQLVEQMNSANTQDIEPLAHPYDEKQPLRDDLVTEDNQRATLQTTAPAAEGGLYIVPQVIEQE